MTWGKAGHDDRLFALCLLKIKKAHLGEPCDLIFYDEKLITKVRPRMDLHHLINSLLGLQDLTINDAKLSEDFVSCRISAELPWNKARCTKGQYLRDTFKV